MTKIEKEAHSWQLLLNGEHMAEDWPRFQQWLHASPEHEEAFRRIRSNSMRSEVPIGSSGCPSASYEPRPVLPVRAGHLLLQSATGHPITAGLVGVVVVAVLATSLARRYSNSPSLVTAPVIHVKLESNDELEWAKATSFPDRSSVLLAARAAVDWYMTDASREFSLRRGKAQFTVERDPHDRPFTVHILDTAVIARGTVFTVVREKDTIWIHVSSGSVFIHTPGCLSLTSCSLKAGQALHIRGDEVRFESHVNASDERLRWAQANMFDFGGVALAKVAAEFNQNNPHRRLIVEADLRQRTITGVFDKTNPQAFARALEESGIASQVPGPNPNDIYLRLPTRMQPGDGVR